VVASDIVFAKELHVPLAALLARRVQNLWERSQDEGRLKDKISYDETSMSIKQ
jgi:hypothetical protein